MRIPLGISFVKAGKNKGVVLLISNSEENEAKNRISFSASPFIGGLERTNGFDILTRIVCKETGELGVSEALIQVPG